VNRALWLLIGLQTRGWVRKAWRSLATLKGALLILFGLGIFVLWLLLLFLAPRGAGATPPENLLRFGPVVFLIYCAMTVLFSKGERAIYFNPGEVNFLFPGPFTRRQLLAYKLIENTLRGLLPVLLMSVLFYLVNVRDRWYLACFLGLFLASLFLQLFTMSVNLLAITLGASAYTRGRKLLLGLLVVVLAVAALQAGRLAGPVGARALFERIEGSVVWQTIATPLRWFVHLFLVEPGDWLDLARYSALSGCVIAVFVLLVFGLDAQYLEAAATASERIYTQLQRMRRGEASGLRLSGGSDKARVSLPAFPWWGGIGPVAWRQTLTAFRSLGRLALLVCILGAILAGPLIAESEGNRQNREVMGPVVAVGVLVYLSLLMTALVPFDFRGDLDRMEVLKSLPLPAWRVAVGQLLVPVALISLIQLLVLVAVQIVWGEVILAMVVVMAFAPPLNFLVFGVDNLTFLWFPSRLMASNPGDFQAMGRNMLFLIIKMLVVLGAALLGAGFGLGAYLLTGGRILPSSGGSLELTGGSPEVALVVVWAAVTGFAAGLIPLLALAFDAFDVSRDIPA
jgi:hypothetical protein